MRKFHLLSLLIYLLPTLGMSQIDSVTPYLFKQYTKWQNYTKRQTGDSYKTEL